MGWRVVLGLAPDERPVAVVVEGTWWRERNTKRRLAHLGAVRELGVPDVFVGRYRGRSVFYACPYGAPRTAEIVQMAARVGVQLAVQIGSCGVVAAGVEPGDVVVPTTALGLDGVSQHYAGTATLAASSAWQELAADRLRRHGLTVHRGAVVTWPTLFNQPTATVRGWQDDGHVGVDMETAATLAVARHFGADGLSMLVAWDEVLSGRSFLDPLPDRQAAAFAAADEATFATALELVERIELRTADDDDGD